MRRVGPLLLLLSIVPGCDRDGRDGADDLRGEVALLRESIVTHQSVIGQLQLRVEELESGLAEERSARREGDASREVLPGVAPVPGAAEQTIVPQCEGGSCTLTRGELDQLLGNPEYLARAGRIIPVIKDGTPNGFKVYGIRTDSLFARIGLKNGDTVQALGDVELRGVEAALAAVKALEGKDRVVIRGVRKDQPLAIEIAIRPDAAAPAPSKP